MKVVDASGLIMGRLASYVAKALLEGEEVVVVNAEKAVISGNRASIFAKYSARRERKSIVNPRRHGPHYPRRPERILKRAVRGMLPYKQERGRRAFKRLRVYVGVPQEYADAEKITFPDASYTKLKIPKYVTLEQLSTYLGAKF
ncbi:MAG TPA: 50S ribosomal protein L13 [Pyrodictium sp.]|nr:50S ribosomal protein L13 [Pyrodictium sp.]